MNTHANESDRHLLLRYLEDDLPPDARREIEAHLHEDDGLRAEYDRLRAVRGALQEAPETFADGFSSRVLQRIRRERDDGLAVLYDSIRGLFLRFAVVTVLLIGAVGTYNAVQYSDALDTRSPVEAALGLPAVTYETALQTEWRFETER